MFVAIYRWKIIQESEEMFLQGWHRRTEEIYRRCGSLGSRSHKAEDGSWAAYAEWPDRETWESAARFEAEDKEAEQMMKESVEESSGDIYMEVVDDLLQRANV
jgi:hypothetical protein